MRVNVPIQPPRDVFLSFAQREVHLLFNIIGNFRV